MDSSSSRPLDFRIAAGIPLALMGALLLPEMRDVDFALTRLFYTPGEGFAGRHSYWLETLLHDRAKEVVIAFGVLALAAFLLSLASARFRQWRRPLGYVVLAIALSTSVVTPLKALTAIHCPWSLSEFGGQETYSPLLGKRAPTASPGRCWPGGHASAGFSLFALFFALRDRRPRLAGVALAVALALGSVFSLGRIMQGAHFLSHNVWTLLIDWIICLSVYRLVLYRRRDSSLAGTFLSPEAVRLPD